MEVIKSSNFRDLNIGPLVLAIGVFDGLHLGHQRIIKNAKKIADDNKLPVGIYTFTPNPLEVLKPALAPRSLISSRQKIELLSNYDLDYYLEQKFTHKFAALDYHDFVKNTLKNNLKVSYLVVGEDFQLGNKGGGSLDKLIEIGESLNLKVLGIKNKVIDNQRVSSTLIRELIEKGMVNKVKKYLGRNYCLNAKIIKGFGRGNRMGIPTANLKLEDDYTLPPDGVYSCYVYYNGEKYIGLVNFGNNPTFPGVNYSIEVHILDFTYKDLYCERLSIEVVEHIRGEITFKNTEELVEQIKKDILYTQNLLCYN